MGQSLVNNYVHLVFSTKNREQLIFPPVEKSLHNYLAYVCEKLDCPPLKVGGYTDPVHLLFMLSKNIALTQLVRELKSNSSAWMKQQSPALSNFYWQTGYSAFSVSHSKIPETSVYIGRQHEHHLEESYQDEMRYHMRINGLELSENYFWN